MVDFAGIFKTAGEKFGVSPSWLDRVATLESNKNPNAKNPYSTASGLFQQIKSNALQYGVDNPFDPMQSTMGAAEFARDNSTYLKRTLGREPKGWELYLAHQQGAGGAAKLLANPNARAVDVVGHDAVVNNAGNESMTAREFAGIWEKKFGEDTGAVSADSQAGSTMSVGTGNFVSDWLIRGTIIVLGFIFVAVGLVMFKPSVANVIPAGRVIKGAVDTVT